MKNVLVHLHPEGKFDQERAALARIQVDNSLELGWGRDELLIVTNFPWEYNGVRAAVVGMEHFCEVRPRSTNTVIVPALYESGILRADEIVWVHDFDAYQQHPFPATDLTRKDLWLTTYGWSPKWCLGSFFSQGAACDIFRAVKKTVEAQELEDERALVRLIRSEAVPASRYGILNITYNFGMRHVKENWQRADKPLLVLHFHPFYRERGLSPRRVFLRGENDLGFPLANERLREVFRHHGIQ